MIVMQPLHEPCMRVAACLQKHTSCSQPIFCNRDLQASQQSVFVGIEVCLAHLLWTLQHRMIACHLQVPAGSPTLGRALS